ncbi:MAG: hypothetical protein AAFR33_10070 [Pseudomonadota bacterium]
MKTWIKRLACLASGLGLAPFAAYAEDHSLIDTSTIIGQNFGYADQTREGAETPAGEVDLVVETAVFFKNLELIDLGELDGETFFGAIVPVRARYAPSDSVSIELGAVLGQNFGDDDSIDEIEPLIRIVAEPADDVFLIGGTLAQTHWMHDALFDDNNKFRDLTEQGLQVRVDRASWKQDTWINWRIREGEIDAEEFEVGNASQLRLLNDLVRLDAQVLWAHAGGQISESRRVDDNFVGRIGGSVGVSQPGGVSWVDDLRLGVHALGSSFSTKDTDSVTSGGVEVKAQADLSPTEGLRLRVHGSFYSGDGLIAERGDPLYGFDEYGQAGASAVWSLGDNLQIEAGGVAQYAGDELNWSALISLSWGATFDLGGIRAR